MLQIPHSNAILDATCIMHETTGDLTNLNIEWKISRIAKVCAIFNGISTIPYTFSGLQQIRIKYTEE